MREHSPCASRRCHGWDASQAARSVAARSVGPHAPAVRIGHGFSGPSNCTHHSPSSVAARMHEMNRHPAGMASSGTHVGHAQSVVSDRTGSSSYCGGGLQNAGSPQHGLSLHLLMNGLCLEHDQASGCRGRCPHLRREPRTRFHVGCAGASATQFRWFWKCQPCVSTFSRRQRLAR